VVVWLLCNSDENCLLNTASRARRARAPASSVTLPGQRYHVDKQCQIIFGDRSFYCAVRYLNNSFFRCDKDLRDVSGP